MRAQADKMRVATRRKRSCGAGRRWARRTAGCRAAWGAVTAAGCSLEEVTLVEAEDVVVAEVYVQVGGGEGGENRVTAWLHRTLAAGSPSSGPVPGAEVLVTDARGFTLELAETAKETCAYDMPVEGTGTCYATTAEFAGEIFPGDLLELEIALPGGGLIRVPWPAAAVGYQGVLVEDVVLEHMARELVCPRFGQLHPGKARLEEDVVINAGVGHVPGLFISDEGSHLE